MFAPKALLIANCDLPSLHDHPGAEPRLTQEKALSCSTLSSPYVARHGSKGQRAHLRAKAAAFEAGAVYEPTYLLEDLRSKLELPRRRERARVRAAPQIVHQHPRKRVPEENLGLAAQQALWQRAQGGG